MTKYEQNACKRYLNALDQKRTDQEYYILTDLLDSQMPTVKNRLLNGGMLVLLIGALAFGLMLHLGCFWSIQSGRYHTAICDYIFGLVLIVFSAGNIYGYYLHKIISKWINKNSKA